MRRRAWIRLIMHGGTFGAVAGMMLIMLFEGGPVETWLAITIAAGLLAGALAAALLYGFRKAPALWRRWLAWPVAAVAGGSLFFASVAAALADWRLPLFFAIIWTSGWLSFLWQPALL